MVLRQSTGRHNGPNLYEEICQTKTADDWAYAEKNRTLGYNGQSKRTQERRRAEGREQERIKAAAKIS